MGIPSALHKYWTLPQWMKGMFPGTDRSGDCSDCCLCVYAEKQFRTPALSGVLGTGAGKRPSRGLHSSTGGLQCSCGQQQHNLEVCDWQERSAQYEPGIQLLDVCAIHSLSITNMFERRGVHQCTWHLDTRGRRSMVVFVVISADLQYN